MVRPASVRKIHGEAAVDHAADGKPHDMGIVCPAGFHQLIDLPGKDSKRWRFRCRAAFTMTVEIIGDDLITLLQIGDKGLPDLAAEAKPMDQDNRFCAFRPCPVIGCMIRLPAGLSRSCPISFKSL